MSFTCKQIGIIETGYEKPEDMPIQPAGSDMKGTILLYDEYIEGLESIELFSHLILLYKFHKADRVKLRVTPFMDSNERGIFATRAPIRPNHIGLSVVRLTGIEGNRLYIDKINVINGTPLIDIKPYIPRFDVISEANNGWLPDDVDLKKIKSDDRFGVDG
ncbi:MAG: tRNA (N6-threonylcarbamoyladenosine(37)-N6)-methyltransferase TrmO [Bacteroidota bacterium]